MKPRPASEARRRAALTMLGAGVCWAVLELGLVGRIPSRYSLYQVVWVRYGVHLLCLLAVAPMSALWTTRRLGLQLTGAACMLGMPAFFIEGVHFAPAQGLWAAFWVAPLLGLLLARVVLREPVAPRTWLACGAAFVGALLVLRAKRLGLPGALMSVGMALSFALFLAVLRMLRDESALSKLFYTALGVFVALTPAMPRIWVPPDPRVLVMMAAIGVVGLLNLYLFERAVEEAPLPASVPFLFAVVLCHALLAWTVIGSGPGRRGAIGAAMVAVALVVEWSARERAGEVSGPWEPHRLRRPDQPPTAGSAPPAARGSGAA